MRLRVDGSFASAFQKPGNYFKATSDMGPVHKRQERATIVTREMNRIMKRSLDYFEAMRAKFALLVMHGVGPAAWDHTRRIPFARAPTPRGHGKGGSHVPVRAVRGATQLEVDNRDRMLERVAEMVRDVMHSNWL